MSLIKRLAKSFKNAANGIKYCARHETNMRIHIIAAAYVYFFSLFYDFSATQYAILTLICIAVLSMELINTAIEVLTDKVSPGYSALAKIAKDIAAGAVFLSAGGAVIIAIFLFWDIEVFKLIFGYFTEDIGRAALLVASFCIAYLFIDNGKKRIKGKREQ